MWMVTFGVGSFMGFRGWLHDPELFTRINRPAGSGRVEVVRRVKAGDFPLRGERLLGERSGRVLVAPQHHALHR